MKFFVFFLVIANSMIPAVMAATHQQSPREQSEAPILSTSDTNLPISIQNAG